MQITYLFLFLFIACGKSSKRPDDLNPQTIDAQIVVQDPLKEVELVTPAAEVVRASIAYKSSDIRKGLSGVKPEAFDDDQGKLFFYFSDASRTFWMRETYFNLDIFYLDKNLKVLKVVRDLPFYEGRQSSRIPRAPSIRSRHVLEMKASSPVSARISIGDQLIWQSSVSMEETIRLMKRNRSL